MSRTKVTNWIKFKSKKVPWFWKKCPDCVHPYVKFAIQNAVLKVSKRKNSKIFPCGAFFLDFLRKCLSKCPNFTKPPLPRKIFGCAPANGYSLDFSCLLEIFYWLFARIISYRESSCWWYFLFFVCFPLNIYEALIDHVKNSNKQSFVDVLQNRRCSVKTGVLKSFSNFMFHML